MSTKTFNMSLPAELVAAVDRQAKRNFSNRSDFIRKAVINQLRQDQTLKDFDELMDRANQRGKEMGITSEQQVYDIIDQAE